MQNLLAIVIVAAAALYLIRRAWQVVTGASASSCGGCRSCSGRSASESATGPPEKGFVDIATLTAVRNKVADK